jgi:hypothetical protein
LAVKPTTSASGAGSFNPPCTLEIASRISSFCHNEEDNENDERYHNAGNGHKYAIEHLL